MSGSYEIGQGVRLRGVFGANPTALRARAQAGAGQIAVRDATGYAANDVLMLNAGGETEESATVQAVAGTVLTLAAPLVYDHAAGERVDELADPTTVTAEYEDPSGNETTLVYGVNAEVVKVSTGIYTVTVTVDEAGRWLYRFAGTGAVIAADEREFYARPSQF